jgi:hypothetical protein
VLAAALVRARPLPSCMRAEIVALSWTRVLHHAGL